MSKVNNEWDNLSDWEKQKAIEEVNRLIRIKIQKKRVNKTPVDERKKDIERKWGRVWIKNEI